MFLEYYNSSTLSTLSQYGKRAFQIEQPLLEKSIEIDESPCITNTEHSPDTKLAAMGTSFFAEEF